MVTWIGGSSGGDEKWLGAGCILKVELIGFLGRMQGVEKREKSRMDPRCLV